jgi:hypothetical protein
MMGFDRNGWRDTPAQAFKAWFRNSVVVSEDGAPVSLFHGTRERFDVFDMSQAKDGAHFFTPLEEHAAFFGPTREFFIRIENPKIISQAALETAWDAEHPNGEQDERSLLPRDFVQSFVQAAKKAGHDGLIIDDMGDLDYCVRVYLPFAPNQIKSATENLGLFDDECPDVTDKTSCHAALIGEDLTQMETKRGLRRRP